MFEVNGKVAFITGGASGIGLAIGKELLENGLKGIAIVDINEENGNSVLESIIAKYGNDKGIFIKTDVADRNQFDFAFKTTVEKYNQLDIVINCAGVVMERNWEREIAINLTGTVTGTILAIETYLRRYKSGNEAVILNLSSIVGIDSCSSLPVYNATKSGIIKFTRTYGSKLHYERAKVRIIAICPGFTGTSLLQKLNELSFINRDYKEIGDKEVGTLIIQDVSNVSKCAIELIKNGGNGSIWVVENNEPPYEVKFPSRQEMGK